MLGLTELIWVHVLHGVNAGQVDNAALDACALFSRQLVDALDHLLLSVDPVQVVAQHGQTHRLQDVVLKNNPIGT